MLMFQRNFLPPSSGLNWGGLGRNGFFRVRLSIRSGQEHWSIRDMVRGMGAGGKSGPIGARKAPVQDTR
jgi:hypothetical protein